MEDVHAYRKRYEIAIRLLRESGISRKNKLLIEKFCNDCFAQGIKAGRVQKYAYILRRVTFAGIIKIMLNFSFINKFFKLI